MLMTPESQELWMNVRSHSVTVSDFVTEKSSDTSLLIHLFDVGF